MQRERQPKQAERVQLRGNLPLGLGGRGSGSRFGETRMGGISLSESGRIGGGFRLGRHRLGRRRRLRRVFGAECLDKDGSLRRRWSGGSSQLLGRGAVRRLEDGIGRCRRLRLGGEIGREWS